MKRLVSKRGCCVDEDVKLDYFERKRIQVDTRQITTLRRFQC